MIGEEVTATFLDRHGGLQHVAGTVRRNAEGELVVSDTPVPRDASVDVKGRSR
jgi:hypothetical protein